MRKLKAILMGCIEFRSAFTQAYPTHDESRCYDMGREWMHRLTFRVFEQ